jgi:hypothetical protein
MKLTLKLGGNEYTVTTEHSTSSHGIPVVLRDGEITDIQAEYTADEAATCHPLDSLAEAAGVWCGPRTREALHDLAGEMLAEVERPRGEDYDRVIAEFQRRRDGLGHARTDAATAEQMERLWIMTIMGT